MKLFNFKKFKQLKINNNKDNAVDPYINIGNIVKENRIKKTYNLRMLSEII